MCTSRDIFQARVDGLVDGTNGVKIYISNKFVIGKDNFQKHIDQIQSIVSRFYNYVLSYN